MLSRGECLLDVQDLVSADDFFLETTRIIYGVIVDLDSRDVEPDAVTIVDELHRGGNLARAGGNHYIASIVEMTPSAVSARAYAKIIRAYSIRRQLTAAARKVIEFSVSDEDVEEIVSLSQQEILRVGAESSVVGPRPIRESISEWIDQLDIRSQNKSEISGLSTGFVDLDKKINGLQPGNLIVVAGRPSMGKSALAMNIANHVASHHRLPCLVFSLEMETSEIVTRLVSQTGKVPVDRLLSGNLDEDQWRKVSESVEKLGRSKAILDESPSLVLSQVRARARREHQHGGLGLIVVDYLQLMGSESQRGTTRAEQISELTRGLKALAKELRVPVMVLSQLNREVDKRVNNRPILSDLKDSGGIEQDADVILFVYRDVVYHPDTRNRKVAEIIVGKQRNGPTGTVLLYFFEDYTMFGQVEHKAQQEFWHDYHRTSSRDSDDFDQFG